MVELLRRIRYTGRRRILMGEGGRDAVVDRFNVRFGVGISVSIGISIELVHLFWQQPSC